MIRTIILSTCLAASFLSLSARAQDERQYADGPVTEVDEVQVEYGHFEEYIDLAKFDMEADHGSLEESWANHRLQGLQGSPQNHRISPIFISGSLTKIWLRL
jgi:uncharacterized membrane protein YecN with MAPEG domain